MIVYLVLGMSYHVQGANGARYNCTMVQYWHLPGTPYISVRLRHVDAIPEDLKSNPTPNTFQSSIFSKHSSLLD